MEWHRVPLSTPERYRRRLIGTGTIGIILVAVSLAIGVAGYMFTEGLAPLDAFVAASMILSGMGPLHDPHTTAGKVFSGLYAIYCGIAVLGIAAIMFAPVVHRLFHRFRIDDAGETPEPKR